MFSLLKILRLLRCWPYLTIAIVSFAAGPQVREPSFTTKFSREKRKNHHWAVFVFHINLTQQIFFFFFFLALLCFHFYIIVKRSKFLQRIYLSRRSIVISNIVTSTTAVLMTLFILLEMDWVTQAARKILNKNTYSKTQHTSLCMYVASF